MSDLEVSDETVADPDPVNEPAAVRVASRKELYPPIEPNVTGYLKVSDLHSLYWEESGNPQGKPVLFLHGGPGGGTSPGCRCFFCPDTYRIILFDQRGSGKSIPHASIEENTTWDLVSDIEKLREHLKVDKWQVFGGSWGSTLALAYAETHPDKVKCLVLRGVFLLRKKEVAWFYQEGASAVFADVWEDFRDFIPEEERHDLVSAYHRRLTNDKDEQLQLEAARHWTKWEMATNHLMPSLESRKRGESDDFALAFASIENHYFVNRGFFESDGWLLKNVDKIRNIPGIIVQGRYDMVCPFMSAWELHKSWPESQLWVIPNAGHSANEVGISEGLVQATEYFKDLH
ncbi:hypothetical protein CBR_g8564 [Chara braunii]|uniref:Proline iminopeptidase n=1 Tax=Chara braunii TaxID=69332 RepID=A0A388JRZ0_CHABU|nr:hypothetical protein CBR_g8564 [Chara braunii]|eukprot:GBG60540.1 hypothetical protein CBR_g8564 [Chara braunii]